MQSITSISMICMIFVLQAVGLSEQHARVEESKPILVFHAQLVHRSVRMGDPVFLKFELKNASSRKVLVKRHFRLNDTVSLDIAGPHGQEVHWCGRIPDWADLPGDFVYLAPGAHVGGVMRVNCNKRLKGTWGYKFPEPGKYSIKASYELNYSLKALRRIADSALIVRGPVIAQSVYLQILPGGWRRR